MTTATDSASRAPGHGRGRFADRTPTGAALDTLAVASLSLVGFALAAYHLGTKSLWLDESVSADHGRLGLSGLWSVITSHDPNMGLYYVLLHFWVRVFGYSEAAVRSMTVVLAGFAVPVMYLLGRRLFGRGAGLIAAFALAIAPFFVQYEQTARSYALLVALVLLSSYLFVTELERHSPVTLAGYALVSVLAVYTHYFALLVLLVQALTLLAVRRRDAFNRRWLTAAAAIVLLSVPAAVFAHRSGTGNISWIRSPGLADLAHLPSDLAGGRLLALVLAVLAVYGFVRALADSLRWQVGFVAAWLVVPPIVVFAESRVRQPLFVVYYLIIVLPPFLLLAAAGAARLPGRWAVAAAIVLFAVPSAVGLRNWYRAPSLEDYRGATRLVIDHERSGDGAVLYPAGALRGPTSGVAYYEARDGARGPRPVSVASATTAGRGGQSLPARIWLVTRRSDTPPQLQQKLQNTLARSYTKVGPQADFRNLIVVLYRR